MKQQQNSPLITVMKKATRKAARHLIRDFGELENLQVSRKGVADFVSSSDLKAEEAIREVLVQSRPDYGLLMEEQGEIKGKDTAHRWIVDPLDGTTNFIHGMPYFCVSIALEKEVRPGKREIVAAVVDAPALGETFWAEKGAGTWVERGNGRMERLRVANRRRLDEMLISAGCGQYGGQKQQNVLAKLSGNVGGIRSLGSTALELAYVAAGRLDGYIQHNEKLWDIAGGILMVKEAGGYVTSIDNRTDVFAAGSVLATNDHLHKLVLKTLNDT